MHSSALVSEPRCQAGYSVAQHRRERTLEAPVTPQRRRQQHRDRDGGHPQRGPADRRGQHERRRCGDHQQQLGRGAGIGHLGGRDDPGRQRHQERQLPAVDRRVGTSQIGTPPVHQVTDGGYALVGAGFVAHGRSAIRGVPVGGAGSLRRWRTTNRRWVGDRGVPDLYVAGTAHDRKDGDVDGHRGGGTHEALRHAPRRRRRRVHGDGGRIFGILGVNGAGKTTTVECLQGLRRPDHGHMGASTWIPAPLAPSCAPSWAASSRRQRCPTACGWRRRSYSSVTAIAARPTASSRRGTSPGCDARASRRCREGNASACSSRGAAQPAPVAFFDELTQGLDPLARVEVWDAIRAVRDRGTTVGLVTHFMDEAGALRDRVAVMRAGRIVDDGTPADLIARHARETTVTFTPPVSFDPAALATLPGVDRVERERRTDARHRHQPADRSRMRRRPGRRPPRAPRPACPSPRSRGRLLVALITDSDAGRQASPAHPTPEGVS